MLRRLRNCSWQENMGFFQMIFLSYFFCWNPDWLTTYDAKESMMSIIYSAEPLLTNWLVLFSIHWLQYKLLEATDKGWFPNWKQPPSHYEQLFATLTNELIFPPTIYECWGYSIRIKTVDNGSCQISPGQTSKRFVVTWQPINAQASRTEHLTQTILSRLQNYPHTIQDNRVQIIYW